MSAAARHVRAALRAALLSLWSLLVWLAIEATRALGRRRARAARARLAQAWARGVLRLIGARVGVDGVPPAAPCLLVTNHLSYVDVAVLWSLLPCRFLAKAEVARWPVVGFLARRAGTLFVQREARRELPGVIAGARAALAAGEILAVFPEGTSSSGAEVLPFRSAFFEVAVQTGVPVRHAALSYETPPGAPPAYLAVGWWGTMTFPDHLYRLLGLAGFRARVAFGAEPIAARDRKDLAKLAHAAVSARFTPRVTS